MDYSPISTNLSPSHPGIFSLAVYTVMVVGLLGLILFLTVFLGEKKDTPEKRRAFECGIIPTGMARLHFPVPFYLVATFFLIFDVEAAFIFAWAVALRPLGWGGWLRITFFIIVLLISLFYLWKKGALEWAPSYRIRPARKVISS